MHPDKNNISENPEDIRGIELYARLAGHFQRESGYRAGDTGQKEASLFLLRAGIDGIRYLGRNRFQIFTYVPHDSQAFIHLFRNHLYIPEQIVAETIHPIG